MAQAKVTKNGNEARPQGRTLYDQAVLGFRNYWYPVGLAKDVTERRPMTVKRLGDEIVLLRRQGKLYALVDECPHRGTRLSRGKHEFPGTPTIACRYHGWVFDVTNGTCVAALTDGPDSPVVGKVRVRTYPVEERAGIAWVWMGRMAPVPVEEDIPPLMLKPGTIINTRAKEVYGNWRWHTENPPGHASMLHRDSIHMIHTQMPAYFPGEAIDGTWELREEGEDGEWFLRVAPPRTMGKLVTYADYPGLGKWPRWRPWRRPNDPKRFSKKTGPKPVRGFRYTLNGVRLPCVTRITHAPVTGCMYYEWYVPVDEDHYIYFQLTTFTPKNIIERLWFYARFFGYGRWAQFWRFNSQDQAMIADSTDFAKRHGGNNPPSKLVRFDQANFAWREHCNAHARGEAVEPAKAKEEKVAVGTEAS